MREIFLVFVIKSSLKFSIRISSTVTCCIGIFFVHISCRIVIISKQKALKTYFPEKSCLNIDICPLPTQFIYYDNHLKLNAFWTVNIGSIRIYSVRKRIKSKTLSVENTKPRSVRGVFEQTKWHKFVRTIWIY